MSDHREASKIQTQIDSSVQLAYARVNALSGAASNQAFTTGGTSPTGVTAASPLNFAAAVLTAKVSGIFNVSVAVEYTGVATNVGVFAVTTQTVASGLALANTTPVGFGCDVASAAAGITVTGGGGSVTQYTFTTEILAGQLSDAFVWSGTVVNSVGTSVARATNAFPKGNQVAFLFSLNATSIWALGPVTISITEQGA